MACGDTAAEIRAYHKTVKEILPDAERRMQVIEDDYQGIKAGILGNHGKLRLTQNQVLALDGEGIPQYWTVNGAMDLVFSHVFDISPSGTPFANRPQEEQELLIGMGKEDMIHSLPSTFSVIRMQWSNVDSSVHPHTFYQKVLSSSPVSMGCYAKLISGGASGNLFNGITDEWSECGQNHDAAPLSYRHPHPYVNTPAGEIMFCLPAVVLGKHHFDKNNPTWGYYQRLPIANSQILE